MCVWCVMCVSKLDDMVDEAFRHKQNVLGGACAHCLRQAILVMFFI